MAIGGTPVPKREIISLILQVIPADRTCEILNVQAATDLPRRLTDFTKGQLLEVLQSTEAGEAALEEAKAKYPLTTSPTLYLVSVSYWPDQQAIIERTATLAEYMREAAHWFGDERTVRSVYMITSAREYRSQIHFLEIPLVYEKKLEYVVADPASDDYGEIDVIYSLERAFIWYSGQFKHALLLCADYSAVKPILSYGNTQLGIRWQLPFLSEEMLLRLAEGASPRTASYSRLVDDVDDEFDVHSMTISDQMLGEKRSYRRLADDDSRHQTAGFYSRHPDLVFGGLGISRRYGRIWTPARLRKDSLLALAINLIQKTEEELTREADINLDGFIGYYRNMPIALAGKTVNSFHRYYVEELAKALIQGRSSPNNETVLGDAFIWGLVANCEALDLIPVLEAHCENCGDYLVRCEICQAPLEPVNNNQPVVFQCLEHQVVLLRDNDSFVCACGAELEITFSTDLRILPGANLLKTLHRFLGDLENQDYNGSFLILGNVFRLIPRAAGGNQYSLSSLRHWRTRAHLHQRAVPQARVQKYTRALNKIKEKCSRNNWHPTRAICDACMGEEITEARLISSDEICLPRIFGFAIDEEFDGIHHGHEVADILYVDVLDESGEQLNLGIHLKSRVKHRARGLGRSVRAIKGLYTQYCYSAYLAAIRGENLDAIGISVPNIIKPEVIENFVYLAGLLGFPLIVLSEDEWVKILDAAIERAAVEI